MCYPKPGPRCSNHLKKSLLAAQEELSAFEARSNYGQDKLRRELQEKVKDRRLQYDGTPEGQRELVILIDEAEADGDEETATELRQRVQLGVQDRLSRVQTLQLVYRDAERYRQPSFEHDLHLHALRATRSELTQMLADNAEKEQTDEVRREANYLALRIASQNQQLEKMKALKSSGLPAERQTEVEGYGVVYSKGDGTTSGYLKRSYEHKDRTFTTYVPIADTTENGDIVLSTGEHVKSSSIKATDVYYQEVAEDEKSDETRRVVYDVRRYMR